MKNEIKTWAQGRFIDQKKYENMGLIWKSEQRRIERCLVRPYPEENAICRCPDPDDAIWIAKRLNIAAEVEALYKMSDAGKLSPLEFTLRVGEILRLKA